MRFPRSALLTAPLLLALLLNGCSWLDSVNPFASSAPKPAPLTSFKPLADLTLQWQTSIGKSAPGHLFQPAIVGDSVYAAASDGAVTRLEEGRTQWRIQSKEPLSAGIGSDGKLAVVVTTKGIVIAYDADNGEERWRTPLSVEVLAPPAVSKELIVVRTSDHRLIALNASTGAQRWTFQRTNPPLSLRSYTSVIVEGGVVLGGFPGGKLIAVSQSNGGLVWELSVASPRGATELERITDIAGPPIISRSELCAVAYQGRIACFDATNGNTLWSRELSSHAGMDRDTRSIYVTDENNAVNALDGFSGAALWKQSSLAHRNLSRPLAVNRHVVVGDLEGYLHVLDPEDGAIVARSRIGSSPIAADPLLYKNGFLVQTRNGEIAAYELH